MLLLPETLEGVTVALLSDPGDALRVTSSHSPPTYTHYSPRVGGKGKGFLANQPLWVGHQTDGQTTCDNLGAPHLAVRGHRRGSPTTHPLPRSLLCVDPFGSLARLRQSRLRVMFLN